MANKKATACCGCQGKADEARLIKQLDAIIKDYCGKPGALIPVLQIAQEMFGGYLPDAGIKRIADGLNKSYSEVAGVIGFYSFFSTVPRGKNLIRVCLGTACYVRGGKAVLDAIKKYLSIDVGETSADSLFTLEVARCFGACGLAPAVMINDDVHKRVRPHKVPELIESYRRGRSAKKGGAR
jgi:NADH:ubiquinone oxidoreductase subunit E